MAGSESLVVGLHGRRIGTLRRVRKGARFMYAEDVVTNLQGAPLLSVALPVRLAEYDAATTAAWFRGLLPEDARLEQIERFYGIEGGDYFDVLERIGWECAGAVSVMSEDDWRARGSISGLERAGYLPLTPENLAERLAALPSYPYDTAETLRMSLGGFQEKMCVLAARLPDGAAYIRADGFAVPRDGAATTHIIKPQPRRFLGLVQAEAWAMHVAASVTDTARTAILDVPGFGQSLCVERYDRCQTVAGVTRIHQEDCAQALGIAPERKYASHSSPKKSDPSFKRIAELLARYAEGDGEVQLSGLFDQMVVNVALGNTDAHAKNYSLVHTTAQGVRLSPLYDVVPALEITPGIRHTGMRIANQIAIEKVGREELLLEAQSWGMAREGLEKRLDADLEKLAVGLQRARAEYPQAAERHEAPALERMSRLA